MYILYCTNINFVFLFNFLVSLEWRNVHVDLGTKPLTEHVLLLTCDDLLDYYSYIFMCMYKLTLYRFMYITMLHVIITLNFSSLKVEY